jgi:energy-coupling factor transporter ATP-binding protein EcfA2
MDGPLASPSHTLRRMSAPTLLWLHIHEYEQFDDVRIRFSPRENLILGVNGAGKTSLLKLILAILSLDFSDLSSQAFDVGFELQTVSAGVVDGDELCVSGRVTNARSAAQSENENAPFGPQMELGAVISYQSIEALIRTEIRGNEISYYQGDSSVAVAKALLPGRSLSLKPNLPGFQDPAFREIIRKLYPRCEGSYLGPSDGEFQALSQDVSFTSDGSELTIDTTAGNLGRALLWNLFPLLLNIGRLDRARFKEGLNLAAEGTLPLPIAIEAVDFQRLFAPLGVRTVRLVPNITREKEKKFECKGIDMRVEFLDGTTLSGSGLTFGQKRYLYAGIVFALHPGDPVLVDELDNGLHPGLIAALLDSWQDRQLFLVSHNKLVIDHTNFSGPKDAQDKIHIVRRAEDGRQSVTALDEATAQDIYDKIAVAIQSPSDVLSAEGLW